MTSEHLGKRSGAWLVRYALEQLPVSHTFGIPGVHNTEIYDELSKSEKLVPVLVTHEACAAFMADGLSRTAPPRVGVLVIVPAAGLTHAMSGIGEAFLDGIPMIIISGGVRTDVPFGYQLHELDQHRILAGLTKKSFRVASHDEIVPFIWEAYRIATQGVPGPVFVEIPVNVQLFEGEAKAVVRPGAEPERLPSDDLLAQAARLLWDAARPGIFVGWGAVDVSAEVEQLAEQLGAPVATTLQGLSSFSGAHSLHTGMGFSKAAVPAAENAFAEIDALLAIGTHFGEIPTGSFGVRVPEQLVHVDIDPESIGRNYKAKVGLVGDARSIVPLLRSRVQGLGPPKSERAQRCKELIAKDKAAYRKEWLETEMKGVNPCRFFDTLRKELLDDGILVVDDGNHTFLAAELFEVRRPRTFISPTDFNCMGYAVPAAIGSKLANPERSVAAVVGDGAFLMTGLEIVTASSEALGIPFFVFADGELSQISQGQEIPYNRKTCTVLGGLKLEGVAMATGARYLLAATDSQLETVVAEAFRLARANEPVIVEVRIDYTKRTRFTKGVVKTVLKRFPLRDKVRFIGRAMLRKVTG